MSDWWDGKPSITTPKQASLNHWRCNFCGVKFKEGDTFRFLAGYERTVNIEGKKWAMSNLKVCIECDAPDPLLFARYTEWLKKYNWMFDDLY